jgi:hypothetical protein
MDTPGRGKNVADSDDDLAGFLAGKLTCSFMLFPDVLA